VEAALLLGHDEDDEGETSVFDFKQRERNGQTALHRVAKRGCPAPLFAVLISAGANVTAKDYVRNTPLLLACKEEKLGMVTMLKDAGADVSEKDEEGKFLPPHRRRPRKQ
jgi:ankyrin repeat protein